VHIVIGRGEEEGFVGCEADAEGYVLGVYRVRLVRTVSVKLCSAYGLNILLVSFSRMWTVEVSRGFQGGKDGASEV